MNMRIPFLPRTRSFLLYLTLAVPCVLFLALLISSPVVFGDSLIVLQDSAPAQQSIAPPEAVPPQEKAPPVPETSPTDLTAAQVNRLSHDLRDKDSRYAYSRLRDFASSVPRTDLKGRAALALGYYDLSKGRYPAAQSWLALAERDPVLFLYTHYWRALAAGKLNHRDELIARLEAFLTDYPDSVLTEQAIRDLGENSLIVGQPKRALALLDTYANISRRPALLLLRARLRQSAGRTAEAVPDYLALYYDFPRSDEAKVARSEIARLRRILNASLFAVPTEKLIGRAAAFYDASQWRDTIAECQEILSKLSGVEKERAEFRSTHARARLTRNPSLLASLKLTDPDLDAERLYELSQVQRMLDRNSAMLATVEQAAANYPSSRWTEQALFSAGNDFWVDLDRETAAKYYARAAVQFPRGRYALISQWRVAWVAYLGRKPEAAALFEEHLNRFPGSQFTENALYWLGRIAQRDGDASHARGYFSRLILRFPQTYFSHQAADRLAELGPGPAEYAPAVATLRGPAPLPRFDDSIPAAAAPYALRAEALRTIAFDSYAESEFRAAYAATRAPRMLWEAARSAVDAGRFSPAINTARSLHPELEARPWEDVNVEVWRTVYPLGFEEPLRKYAKRRGVDPAIVAGLIRQESIFQPDAVSRAGAIGLMQVLPSTGRRLARHERVSYSRARLFDPEYNLRLGTLYFSIRLNELGSVEAALAAYNAGAHRVALWQAERKYAEPAEFVESIPFTETREYVQIVTRNAEIYRRLLHGSPAQTSSKATPTSEQAN